MINSLILVGIIQGFVFGTGYLFSKKNKNKATFYLALLIICFSYNNLQFYLADTKIITGAKMYQTFYIPVGTLIPVFVYFFVLQFTTGITYSFKKRLLFFIPFLLFFLNALIYKIYPLFAPVTASIYQKFRLINNIQSFTSLFYSLFLIAYSYRHVLLFQKKQHRNDSRLIKKTRWLKKTLIILFCLSLFWSFALLKYMANVEYTIYFNLLWVGLSVTIYWLGYFGIYKYGIQEERKKIRSFSENQKSYSISEKIKNVHIVSLEKLLIEDKQFLNPKISLEGLSEELKLSKTHLSRLINAELNTSFSDYINQLRVAEAKKYLLHPEFSDYTLVAIGLEAGFNSKTTFNTAFKKFTGLTPSAYRKQQN